MKAIFLMVGDELRKPSSSRCSKEFMKGPPLCSNCLEKTSTSVRLKLCCAMSSANFDTAVNFQNYGQSKNKDLCCGRQNYLNSSCAITMTGLMDWQKRPNLTVLDALNLVKPAKWLRPHGTYKQTHSWTEHKLYLPKQFHKQRPKLQNISFILGHKKLLELWDQLL